MGRRWGNTITKEVEVEFDLEDVLEFIEMLLKVIWKKLRKLVYMNFQKKLISQQFYKFLT